MYYKNGRTAHRQRPEGVSTRRPIARSSSIFGIMRAKGGDAMDVNVIMQAISNVGFPIVAFCLMWYLCNTTIKENTQAITELRITMDDIKNGGDT